MNGANPEPAHKETRPEYLKEFNAGASFEHRFTIRAPIDSLNQYIVRDYPTWTLDVPDVVARAHLHRTISMNGSRRAACRPGHGAAPVRPHRRHYSQLRHAAGLHGRQ